MNSLSRKVPIRRAHMLGVTLLELMIVVVIVGILAAFAYPSYRAQVMKTHRADGKAMLMQVSQQLERCYTRFSRYDDGNCAVVLPDDSPEGHYTVDATALTASAFTLDATPQGGQADDTKCGALRLTSTGVESASTGVDECW